MTSTPFSDKKQRILKQLSSPDEEYDDLSPKGTVDVAIRSLINDVNDIDGLVTTSSCSGRISVFLEGKRAVRGEVAPTVDVSVPSSSNASVGGKGGGDWLFVSHELVELPLDNAATDLMSMFDMTATHLDSRQQLARRYIHFKFEAMILHVLARSTDHAQYVISAALDAGFRESGAVSLPSSSDDTRSPVVAVRSAGLGLDSIIGYQTAEGINVAMVGEEYLQELLRISNSRFDINSERIQRFHTSLVRYFAKDEPTVRGAGASRWEPEEARRARKRAEGLRRQRDLQTANTRKAAEVSINEDADMYLPNDQP